MPDEVRGLARLRAYSEVVGGNGFWIKPAEAEHAAAAVRAHLAALAADEQVRERVAIAVRRAEYDVRRRNQSRNEARADAAVAAFLAAAEEEGR